MAMWIRRVWILLLALALCVVLLGQMPAPRNDVEITRGIAYRTVAGKTLTLDLYLPRDAQGPLPVVVAVHGGSWMAGSGSELFALSHALAERGYAVVVPEYRLAPDHVYPAQLEDIQAAARWTVAQAKTYGFDLQHYIVFGMSAGGQLAGLLALNPPADLPKPCCFIDLFGPMDFTAKPPSLKAEIVVKMYLGASKDEKPALYRAASPITYVTPDDPPCLVVHGASDDVVPINQSERLVAALKTAKVPVEYQVIPEGRHVLPTPMTASGRAMLGQVLAYLDGQCGR